MVVITQPKRNQLKKLNYGAYKCQQIEAMRSLLGRRKWQMQMETMLPNGMARWYGTSRRRESDPVVQRPAAAAKRV